MNHKAAALLTTVVMMVASPTWASSLLFQYVGNEGTLSFTLDTSPVPALAVDGLATLLTPLGQENGVDSDFGGGIYFYNNDFSGGFETLDQAFLTNGRQIYSGSESAPVFAPGVFALTGFEATNDGVLTVSNSTVSAAPEPSTWVIMMVGVGLLGAALRLKPPLGLRRDKRAFAD